MAFRDLREFLAALESRGELRRIRAEVSPELEAAEIADRVVKSGGPAILFENVRGTSVPLAMNLFGTMERMCFALGVPRLDDIAERVQEVIEPEIPTNFLEKLKMLPKLARLADFVPKTVSSAPCQEVVEKDRPSLSFLPVVKTWPGDGGPFITLPLVFTKDPKTGRRNVGMYRVQVLGREKDVSERFRAADDSYLEAHLRSITYYALFFPLIELLTARDSVQDPAGPRALPAPVQGALRFDDVSFTYPTRPDAPP